MLQHAQTDVITATSASPEAPLPRIGNIATVDISAFMTANGITGIKGFRMNEPGEQLYGIALYEFTTDGVTYPNPSQLNVISETGTPAAIYSWSEWGSANPAAPYTQYNTATECVISQVNVGGTTTFKVQDYGLTYGHQDDNLWIVDQDGNEWALYTSTPTTTLTFASDKDLEYLEAGDTLNQLASKAPETRAITSVVDEPPRTPFTVTNND